MYKSKYIYLLHCFWIIILYSFCHSMSHLQACVVKILPSFSKNTHAFHIKYNTVTLKGKF